MAQMLLIMGESGTGKSASMRNCDPETTAVVNPVGKPLPFKGHFETLNNVTDGKQISKWMKEQADAGKKLIVVDDFQYILSVPYMNRIQEPGWDKWNDFGFNYFEVIDVCKDIPDDVIVAYMSHCETLDNGVTTIKLIGKMLREKITIEGLFTIVLRTGVNEEKYYFYTQNSGKDTVKAPMGMFSSYAIDNDLAYVCDKVRNYYEMSGAVSDEEIQAKDQKAEVQKEKPTRHSRSKTKEEPKQEEEKPQRRSRSKEPEKTVEEEGPVVPVSTHGAGEDFMNIPEDAPDEIPFEEEEPKTLARTAYFYLPETDNYVKKNAGDVAPEGGKKITKKEFEEGAARIAKESQQQPVKRTRRTRGGSEDE